MITLGNKGASVPRWAVGITFLVILFWANGAFAKEHVKTLHFDKGRVSTVVSGAVIRGEVDSYLFTAKAGQRMSLALMSLEDNAVFELFTRRGGKWHSLVAEKRAWYGKLPPTSKGRYKVMVSGTRGNATYELFAGISAISH